MKAALIDLALALCLWVVFGSVVGWVLYATAITCAWHLGVLVR